jgi:hypothetical protein
MNCCHWLRSRAKPIPETMIDCRAPVERIFDDRLVTDGPLAADYGPTLGAVGD